MEENNSIETISGYDDPDEPKSMSLTGKILGIFLDPKRTFTSLRHKPDFIVPLALLVFATFLTTWIAWPVIEVSSMEMMEEGMIDRGMDEAQIEQMKVQQQKMGKLFGMVGAPFSTVLMAFIISGVLLFAGNIVMGGNAKYGQILSIYCYTSLISIISLTVRTILIMGKSSLEIYTSPAALFPADMSDGIVFKIANIFDVFVIWEIIVLSIGMGIIYSIDTRKPLITVSMLYLLFAAVSISISAGH